MDQNKIDEAIELAWSRMNDEKLTLQEARDAMGRSPKARYVSLAITAIDEAQLWLRADDVLNKKKEQ